MSERTKSELLDLIEKLDEVPPCPTHGRDEQEICIQCGEAVRCALCDPVPCQCWNDA